MNRNGIVKGRWLGKLTGSLAAVLLGAAFLGASPVETARADGYISFGIGSSFGHGYRHHRYGYSRYGHRAYRYRHYKHRRYGHHHHRQSHVTYKKVVPAAPQATRTKETAAEDLRQACLMIREYQTKITVGGKEVDAYGDACLQPDGSWRLGAPKQVPAG